MMNVVRAVISWSVESAKPTIGVQFAKELGSWKLCQHVINFWKGVYLLEYTSI